MLGGVENAERVNSGMRIPNWYRIEKNGIRFYQAWNLQETGLVTHGFSARVGGVSPEPYASLNLGLGTKDDPSNVLANRRAYASVLGVDAERIIVPQQSHGNRVMRVGVLDAGRGALSYASGIPDTDALITNEPGVTLALHFADCVCVFLLDPVRKAIGVVHAGWRGTVAGVVTETLTAMSHEFDTRPEEVIAAIGPAIGRHCYDVNADVAEAFFKAFPHDERVMSFYSSVGKWRVDLKTANLILLLNAGVKQENIAVSEDCTCCNGEDFFSHRRDGTTGRMGGWMALLPFS